MSKAEVGAARLQSGSRLYGQALRLILNGGDVQRARTKLRECLPVLRSAMNWLEDSPGFEVAHERLDDAGELARRHDPAGCRLAFREGSYYQECPVALAHNRVGLSPGFIIRSAECSICRADPEGCSHIVGRTYDGQICSRVITRAELLEASLVTRPAFPDARISSVSISRGDLQARLGVDFKTGVDVTCDRCLGPCDGVMRPFEEAGHGVIRRG